MAAEAASFFSPKAIRAIAVAAILVAGFNAWMGTRLPNMLLESGVDVLTELDHRVAACAHKDDVEVLVFGGSHAVAGLRPPALAAGFGLSADQIFNLGLPSSSAFEQVLMAERYVARFPHARTAIVNVDECVVGIDQPIRSRYITRGSLGERWRYASYLGSLDERMGVMVAACFPVLDFGLPITEALQLRPATTARRFFVDRPIEPSGATCYASMTYPWGLPPPWEHPGLFRPRRAFLEPEYLKFRISRLLDGRDRQANGFAWLATLLDQLKARGMQVVLVSTPYHPVLRRQLEAEPGYRAYKQVLGQFLAERRLAIATVPDVADPGLFHDPDHPNERGARRIADWLHGRFARLPGVGSRSAGL
jgi:hypothetical protein